MFIFLIFTKTWLRDRLTDWLSDTPRPREATASKKNHKSTSYVISLNSSIQRWKRYTSKKTWYRYLHVTYYMSLYPCGIENMIFQVYIRCMWSCREKNRTTNLISWFNRVFKVTESKILKNTTGSRLETEQNLQ